MSGDEKTINGRSYEEIAESLFEVEEDKTDFDCPNDECEGEIVLHRTKVMGPRAGRAKCDECDYDSSIHSFLGNSVIDVEPIEDEG